MLDDDLAVVILANTNLVDTDRLGFQIARHVVGVMRMCGALAREPSRAHPGNPEQVVEESLQTASSRL